MITRAETPTKVAKAIVGSWSLYHSTIDVMSEGRVARKMVARAMTRTPSSPKHESGAGAGDGAPGVEAGGRAGGDGGGGAGLLEETGRETSVADVNGDSER